MSSALVIANAVVWIVLIAISSRMSHDSLRPMGVLIAVGLAWTGATVAVL